MTEIKIILTLDLDPDLPFRHPNRWRGLKLGSLKLAVMLKKKFKRHVPISWFVRIDDETKKEFSGYEGILKKNNKLFYKLKKLGGMFYIHPHLYTYDKKKNLWLQDLDDKKNILQLSKIIKASKKFKLIKNKVIRIGGHFFSKKILEFLIEKRYIIDSTSLPGRVGNIRKPFNWKKSKKELHYLKIKNKKGKIIEAPPTMIKIKANYDKKPYNRYLDLTFKHSLMKKYINSVKLSNYYIMTLSHPTQFVKKARHGLLCYGVENYLKNIDLIIKRIKKMGYKYNFYYIEDLIKYKRYKKLKTYEK